MPTPLETLERLATAFTVRDIMTPTTDLVCAPDEVQAILVSDGNPDFDVIPIKQNGKLTGYFERSFRGAKKIAPSDLISDGTSLLDLVELLEKRPFFFVLSRQEILGYAHFSDLNHQLVKLTFYVILEALERVALGSIRGRDDRESLRRDLDPERFNRIEKLYKHAGQAARSLVSYLNIHDMLTLAAKAGALQIDEHMAKAMKGVRDGAAHVSKNLVSRYDDVKVLSDVKRECLRILGSA